MTSRDPKGQGHSDIFVCNISDIFVCNISVEC